MEQQIIIQDNSITVVQKRYTKLNAERRKARRWEREIEMQIRVGGCLNTVYTKDISSTGVAFAMDLPSNVPSTFKAQVSLRNGTVEIIFRKLSNGRAQILDVNNWSFFKRFLNDLVF